MRTVLAFLLSACGLVAQEKFIAVTLSASQTPQSKTVIIPSGETFQLVSLLPKAESLSFPDLLIEKDGDKSSYYMAQNQSTFNDALYPLVVPGPAAIKVVGYGGMATFKITPDQYPPDKTVVVPGGPGGANVTMECSTNLVHWTPADNGAYTNLPGVKFFRIKLDRIHP